MASYEWVIEQETPDGVTTRIVFDFADDEAERYGGRPRASVSGASYHPHYRRDSRGRGGNASGGGGGNVGAGSSGPTGSATAGNSASTFFFVKDAARSEGGGSSRRSSKHSNGSRSRRHAPHHSHHRSHHSVGGASGSNGNGGGAGVNGGGGAAAGSAGGSSRGRLPPMVSPTGSAYTSAALRQRYQRMLVGGARGTVATSVANRGGISDMTPAPATQSSGASYMPASTRGCAGPFESAVNAEDGAGRSATAKTLLGLQAAEVPPSTLFMSAYGAEVVDEEETQSSNSSPVHPTRLSHGSTGSSGHSSIRGGGGGGEDRGRGGAAVRVHASGRETWWAPDSAGVAGLSAAPAPHAFDQPQEEQQQRHGMSSGVARSSASARQVGDLLEHQQPSNAAASHSAAWRRRGRRGGVGVGGQIPADAHDEDADDDDDSDEAEAEAEAEGGVEGRPGGRSNTSSSGDGSYYVLRDVWAARARRPRRVANPRAFNFPAFPPLHPISVDSDDDGDDNDEGNEPPLPVCAVASASCNPSSNATAPVASSAIRDVFGGTDGITMPRSPTGSAWTAESPVSPFLPTATTRSSGGGGGDQRGNHVFGFPTSPTDGPLEHRQYNKMLLKKERQRHRGRGWQPILSYTSPNTAPTAATTEMRAASILRRDERQARRHSIRGALRHERPSTSGSDSTDADDESCSDGDGDDTSSLECLSATSSDDSDDTRGLCADTRFTAAVQSLASRAGRARRKMEAQEGAEEDEAERCGVEDVHAATSRKGGLLRTSGVAGGEGNGASLATALRRGGDCANGGGGGSSAAPSSFFISPIHQSVAAESAGWTAGTGFQFLGHGGLGGDARAATLASTAAASSSLEDRRHAGSRKRRRRGRDEENEEADDATDAHTRVHHHPDYQPHPQHQPPSRADAPQRSRKRRKKGDALRQSVTGECGGSRALRPVAAPSNGPPLEILPSSKSDMREDLLESFLMEAVLDEDDFHLF